MLLAAAVLLLQVAAFSSSGPGGAVDRAEQTTPSPAAHAAFSAERSSFSFVAAHPDRSLPSARASHAATLADAPDDTHPSKSAISTPDDSAVLSGLYVPPPPLPFDARPIEATRNNRLWSVLAITQHGAATFDAWSTRRALSLANHAEEDPLLRPFAHSPLIYGAIQLGPTLLDFVSRRMQRSEHRWVRKLWWVPQTASSVGFFYSGARNLNVSRR
jgi:hypothetical protein